MKKNKTFLRVLSAALIGFFLGNPVSTGALVQELSMQEVTLIRPPWLSGKGPSLNLRQCMAYAGKHAPEVLSARDQIKAQSHRVKASKKDYLPKAVADLNVGLNQELDPRIFSSAGFDMPLFWAPIRAEIRLAENRLTESRYQEEAAVHQATLTVVSAYHQLLYRQRIVTLVEDMVRQLEEKNRVIEALFDAGRALRVDKLKIESALWEVKMKLEGARTGRDESAFQFAALLGRKPSRNVVLQEQAYLPLPFTLKEVYRLAGSHSPRLKILDAQLKEIELKSKKEKWSAVKDLNFSVRAQRQDASYVNPRDQNEVVAGIRGGMDLFDWGKKKAERTAEFYEHSAETRDLEQARNEFKMEIKNQYEELRMHEFQARSAWQSIQALQAEYQAELVRFNHGLIKVQDLLTTHAYLSRALLNYEKEQFERHLTKAQLLALMGVWDISKYAKPDLHPKDPDLLRILMRRAFLFFKEEYEPQSGLFYDADGGGHSSMAANGFGLAALAVGAERGWMPRTRSYARALQTLQTLVWLQENGRSHEGFFFHFVDPVTGEPAPGSEISIVDTAILTAGAVVAAEYFGGEVKLLFERLYRNIHWDAMLEREGKHANQFYLGWIPGHGPTSFYWDTYTDETLLIVLMALGSPQGKAGREIYDAMRKELRSYKNHSFYPSWSGSLFTYQYANLFFDFKAYKDSGGIGWFENAVAAVKAQIDYLWELREKSKAYAKGFWGVSAGEVPSGKYDMMLGPKPNLRDEDDLRGILVPASVAGSLEYVPGPALKMLRTLYAEYPQLWGRYGFTSSFDLDLGWHSSKYYALDQGVILFALENYLHGTVRRTFMKSSYIQHALSRAGFSKQQLPHSMRTNQGEMK